MYKPKITRVFFNAYDNHVIQFTYAISCLTDIISMLYRSATAITLR